MKLIDLKRGEKGKIVKIGNIGILKRRFIDMGITIGEVIEFERKAPLGDPQQYKIRDNKIAIRKNDLQKIEIEKI